jgi:hypothetical protein
MADEQPGTRPLDYLPRTTRRPGRRGLVVALAGAVVAVGGAAVFIAAHSLTETDFLVAEHRRQHELLWAAFGIALLLCGTIIAAVGLKAWCGRDAEGN